MIQKKESIELVALVSSCNSFKTTHLGALDVRLRETLADYLDSTR